MPTKSGIIGTVKIKTEDGTYVDLPDPIPLKKITAFAEQYEFVKVVRCRDCKWYEIYQLKQDGTDDRRYNPSYCTLFRHRFKPEWYCADGERKGEE